jgi:hypothetical protein
LSAGASSRLLIDYPDAQRQEILDYLFKPSFGAALSILKVEIGGDMNSTDGSEPSHEPVRGQEDYQRGYEWWLMKQAKARNPSIKLSALAWGAPGWIGNGNFWSQDNIDYQIRWLKHATADHGLALDYMGGWNERSFDASWFISFKKALQSQGFAGKLVGADDNWNIVTAMQGDANFKSAVDVVGVHYPCGYLGNGGSCPSPAAAQQSGKILWASEEGSQHYNSGAGHLAKAVNRVYIDGKMTALINWSVVWSAYATLPFSGDGLMLANTPWSGSYDVGKSIWVVAHTTQFAEPGWRYLDGACGYLGGNRDIGSYVTLLSPSGNDYSLVVETVDAPADEPFTFTPVGALAGGPVHVWRTDLSSNDPASQFAQQPDLQPDNCAYSLALKRGSLYTLTTTTGQAKGTANPPATKPMVIPYADNFEAYSAGAEARYFSDINGAFVAAACAAGRAGMCLAQTVPAKPILWNGFDGVRSIVGDPGWTDYQVQSDVLLQQSGTVQIMGRLSTLNDQTTVPGYILEAVDNGTWRLYLSRPDRSEQKLASGSVSVATGTWHTLKLVFHGQNIEGWIDGTRVAAVTDNTYASGNAGVGVGGWTLAQFDNFNVSVPN